MTLPFYITTPVYYANAALHVSTAYTTVVENLWSASNRDPIGSKAPPTEMSLHVKSELVS